MTDYTNTFGGAAKDAADDTILGADHDTEFDNIATAIGTKANKIIGGTSGNLIELDSSGDIVDSGIDSADVDSLSGVVQTALNTKVDKYAVQTSHVRGGNVQLVDGTLSLSPIDVYNVTGFESIGPTGSGADNIWTALDNVPTAANPRALILVSELTMTSSSTSTSQALLYVSDGDVTPATNDSTWSLRHRHNNDATNEVVTFPAMLIVPCNSSVVFKVNDSVGNATAVWNLHYRGFIHD